MHTLALFGVLLLVGCGDSSTSDPDVGVADLGLSDTGPRDTGPAADSGSDAGETTDTGAPDTGPEDAGARDTWDNRMSGLFQTYCVGCHGAGNAMRDYTTYADAFRDRAEIRCGVAPGPARPRGCSGFPPPGQFPVGNGPFPTQEERQSFVDWVDQGAPER